MSRRRRDLRPIVDELDDRCLLSGASGLTPGDITSAYGLSGITFATSSGATVNADGSGETIALIEMYHDPNLASDLHTFDQKYNLPDPTLNVVDQSGGQTDTGWGQEESLDVEWAHAIAPGASILVIEAAPGYAGTQALQNLMSAVTTASTAGTASTLNIPPVAVVSMSWGFNEFPGEIQYDASFTTPGITYIAASGDTPGAEYPAASPDVIAVGGTSLILSGSGGYGSETAWYDSGGGYSQYEAEPAYQKSVQTTGQRSAPDVAFVGDPSTGAMVYFTPAGAPWQSSAPQGSWYTVGGTSLGAPSWAGIVAIVDQGRVQTGQLNLTGATQTLPSLYSLASSAATSGDFHAIAATSTGIPWSGGGWSGFGGWGAWSWGGDGGTSPTGTSTSGATANTQTGLGTPNGPSVINDLVASTVTAPVPSPTSTPTSIIMPMPTPTPSPTPPPSPTGGKHHRHKPPHKAAKQKAHAAAAHTKQVTKQGKLADRPHPGKHHQF